MPSKSKFSPEVCIKGERKKRQVEIVQVTIQKYPTRLGKKILLIRLVQNRKMIWQSLMQIELLNVTKSVQ